MRTNVLNDLSNVVKKGTSLACSWNQVGRMSEGAPDEHPMSIRSASDGERWKPAGEKGSIRVWKHVAMIFAVLVMSMANIGMAWGANGDVLFNQGFGSATAVAYSANTARSYSTSSTLSGLVGTGDNLFQGAQCTAKTNCGIAINTTSGANSYSTAGTFQAYANNTGWKWALYKTTNFATTAPTAIKFEMDYIGKYVAAGKQEIAVVVGSGFSVGTDAPAANKGYTGFNIISGSSGSAKHCIGKVGGTTKLESTGYISNGTSAHITWIINATGSDLTYTGPDSKSYTLATAKYDLWVGTTRVLTAQDRATTGSSDYTGTTMQNLYIGNAVSGKHEVIIDNVKVTDLTPDPCDAADLTASNITSNGNQEAGTGITFSKVGTPASGDTWYWQTSATGTDKTYNATSPYTTATTAGSYTVYLRAFNTDCWGEAASMTNTIYPAPSAMIHNTFAVNDAWSSTIATQDKTNITSLNAMAAVGESVGSGSNKSGLTQKIPSQLSEDASKYMSLSFNVASGKQLNVTSVVFDEQPVTGTGTFKVSISDNQGSTTKTQTIASGAAGSKHTLTLDGDIVGSFKGTVTVKVWAYGWGDGYRFGDYFYINGTVTASCSAPTTTFANGSYTIGGSALDLSTLIGSNNSSGAITYTVKNANGTGASISTASFTASSAGTCTVTATQAANGDKCEKVMDATITVSAPAGSGWGIAGDMNSWTAASNEMTGSGTVSTTISLSANTQYEFKVVDMNTSTWYGNGGTIKGGITDWNFTTDGGNTYLRTSCAGDYTFTFNTSTKNLSITYPNSHKVYFDKDGASWSNIYAYGYNDGDWNIGWPGVEITSNTEDHCGTEYYAYTNGYTYIIFNNGSGGVGNQTGNITVAGYEGKHAVGAAATGWTAYPTYTISYNNGGGSGSMSSQTSIACSTDKATTANTFTRSGYNFTGWHANVDVTVGGATKTAGTLLADGVTIQNINSDITLTAQWELIPTYDVIYNTNGGTGGSTASQTGNLSGAQVTTSANGFTKTGYKFKWWNTAANGSGEDFYPGEKVTIASADVNLYAQWEQVSDGWEFWCGSPNAFTTSQAVVGDMVLTAGGGSTTINTGMEADATIVSKYNSSVDKHAICIAVASNDQYVQVSFSDGSPINSLKLWATTNQTSSKKLVVIYSTTADFSSGQYEAKEVSVPANNAASKALTDFSPATADKYLYARIYRKVATAVYEFTGGSGNTARIYGVKAEKGTLCIAPSALGAASPTAKGITLSVTDANNVNNYEFYVSTSSTAPEAGATATHSVSSAKSLTITNLVAGTTYYAWARSVCGVSNKSGWTALTGSTFTTSTVTMASTLTNVTHTSGATSGIGGSNYTAVFTASTGYSMPNPTVTIGGNAATSGTDYTWSVDGSVGTITIPANKINGNIAITLNSAKAAPSSVTVDGIWHRFPGETITLTAEVTGGNGPKTYQWYKGEDAIVGATSATYTKASCEYADAGDYWCTVTCGGTESTSSGVFQVKILRLYVKTGKYDGNTKSDYGNVDFTKVDGSTATASINLGANWDYCFNIADGCGHAYGYADEITVDDCTDWTINVNNQDCGLRSTNGAYYLFTIDYSAFPDMVLTVTYPTGDQAADKIIYFDNQTVNWSTLHYRVGKTNHTQATPMTKVPGTNNLWKVTTTEYLGFAGWHIANNAGWTGDDNSIYRTYTNGDAYSITKATAHDGGAVTQAAITVTPTNSIGNGADVGLNDNCEFFNYTRTDGMKTQNVTISPYTNGTITVNYVNTSDVASSFTSGTESLAHSVILTSITAVPNTGYDASAITINGGAYAANYVVTGATTIAATFSLHNYNVTYSAPGNGNNYTIKVADGSATSASKTATMGQTITIVATPATGYDFTGWTISKAGGGTVTPADASATTTTFTMPTDNVTITASFTLKTYTVTYNAGSGAGISGSHANDTKTYGVNLTLPGVTFTRTGYTQTGWATSDGGSQAYALSGSYTTNAAANLYPVWTAKTTTITINANTANHGSTTPGTVTATWGSALPSFSAATGVSSWSLIGYYTAATGGNKIINADGTLVASTTYADGSGHWNSEAATLTLYAQYEEVCTPQTISKVVLTAVDAGTVSGYNENEYAGAAVIGGLKSTNTAEVDASHAGVETGYKLNDNGKGIVFATLAKGTFQVGDVIKVTITYPNDNHTFAAPVSSKEALELFYGTNKDDATSLTILTGVSAAGTYSYTLTAADVTAIGSKKGIGVFRHSDRKQNPFVYSVEIYGCRDWVIEEEGLVNWTMNLNTNTWGTSSTSTTDETNISSISTSANTTDGTREGTTKKINLASAADNVNNAASFTFSLNSAKKIEPEKVTCKVFNVGDDEGLNYKAQLSDDNGHVYYSTNTVIPNTEATLTDAVFNFASDLILTGDITVKVYCWKSSGSGSAFRMGPKIRFFGEVQSAADYTVTHTLSNVTKSAGATSVKEGNNYTATYAVAGDYALPSTITVTIGGSPATAGTDYTWTQGTGVVTILGNKVTGNIVITVTGVAVVNYSITYHCNGAESGCPSNVAATTNLPSPLPTGMTKDGYDFGGWFTDSECTVAAVAGAALTGNTDLYAKWTERGSGCEDTPHAWDVIATSAKSYKVRISKVTEEVAIPVADATASNLTAYAGSVSTNDNVTVQIADGGSSKYGYKFDGSNTYLKLVFSTPLVLNDTLVVGMTNASHNISFTTTAVRSTTLSTSGGKLIIPAALAGQTTIYLWRGSGSTMYLRSFAVKHECEAIPSCTTPVIPALSNQTVCEGSDIAAWNATPTNASTISDKSESVSYSWKKKGNDTELANTATFDLGSSAAESQAGTYVVTVTVSKAGYASASASKEVDLTVTDGIEVTGITADKATVYPTNSVTLTATASADATWQWYTCTNAEGAGESSIGGATSASYTIASAGAAGTYYYKAKATGSCGTAERVYTLTVSESSGGDCETEFWFAKAADKPEGATAATHISGTPSGSSSASYTATIDGNNYTITGQTGQKTGNVTITVPEDYEGTLYVVVQGSSSRTITLSKGGVQVGQETPANSTWGTFTFSNLDAGTYTLVSSGNIGWGILALKLCSAVACSDPEVTASADNTTACVGTSVTFTAANAHASATYQWQKLNGTWTNISDETASTYTITSVVAGDAGKYRVIASHDCNRTSNEVTLSVPSAPNFGSTVPASVSVMQTIALSINTVEATDAVKYRWYKSADGTWDAGDVEIGTNKELIKAYDSEAIGSPSYYIFCRAQNSCGITTSDPIAVNVTAYVEEDCATRGNEGEAQFGFVNTSAGQGSYQSTNCWTMNSNSKYLTYTAPEGKYFKTMKVTIASSSASKASYNWSTNGGTTFTEVAINSINTTLTEKTIDVSAHGNVNALQIGRNLDGKGESSGTLYVSKVCFEYTDACTATTVTPSTSSVNYEMGGAWSNPTFILSPAVGTLTYSSSDEDIATVDDDGTVTFNGDAGSVTITASYAGDVTYCASEGSYTITVSCPGGAPKVVPDGTVNMSGCNSSITLNAKKQDGTAFADGTYQWFRNGEEIDGATSSSYTATQAGTYTVERTNGTGCTTPSTNSAIVTSETTEPEVERLVPFQYYHVDKTYSNQMKMRHLFAVKNSGKLDGKSFKMYVSRNGGAATDVTSSDALVVKPNDDGHVDTVMVNLNELSGKYSENDELVYTCKAIDCSGNVSEVYKNTITMRVIGATPTLALICSGSSKAEGTRKTGELTVGGDFLTGYNVADLCQQTGNTSFDANTEWGLYTDLKTQYIVTPVNGYAVFNKLNYEPFDILLLTDYPKASKSDAAKDVLDDMAALCDYRPMLSFKTHMVAKSPSKWAAKGFTTSATENKADGRLNLNIVCYAHPMFEHLKDGANVYRDADNSSELVYTMLSGTGYEGNKGMQGFEIDAAENFVTIGLTHYNASAAPNTPSTGNLRWTPGSGDRMLVTVAERQTNIEARFILFSINCGAQSKLTDKGEEVILACLEYLLDDDPLHVADCSFTFDNGANAPHDADWYKVPANCPGCSGTMGDGLWSTEANWGPERINIPEEFTSARIAAPVTVDLEHAKAMELRIIDEGRIVIPAGKALDVKSTIRRMDGSEIYPTEIGDIHIGSASTGNGTLIFNNNSGDTKARVDMYSNALADVANMSAATSTWQYIGTPHNDVAIATYNYYDSWLYQYSGSGWEVIPNGGPLVPFRGYCVTHPDAPVVFSMEGTLVATTAQSIAIPVGYTVIANSWVAPIDISTFTDDDMENISDKTIYFFNTGSDADGTAGTGTEAGTYVAVPKNSASYVGTWQIPSMQGFYISTSSAGTLHLDYDRHVRPAGDRSVVSNLMYAPRRAKAAEEEPAVLKIFARGSRYQDKLVVLEREDFTRGYDSGWDGEAWGGGTLSPMVYVTGEGREDAVSAIPEFEGTVVAFKAGEDSEYRFEFIYDGDESLYLFDTENNTYTQIMTGESYYFSTDDKAPHSRFILTRKAPQIATGVEPTSDGEGAKARKLLIEDKMYILLNGMLYDATGKVVK